MFNNNITKISFCHNYLRYMYMYSCTCTCTVVHVIALKWYHQFVMKHINNCMFNNILITITTHLNKIMNNNPK